MVPAISAGFIEIELDLETGKYEVIDFLGVADCGTVLHPQGLATQVKGGAVMGIGLALSERHIYDSQNGLPANSTMYESKLPTYLDVPGEMQSLGCRHCGRAEPRRRQGHRRTRSGQRRGGRARRNLRRAGRALLQSRARSARHDRKRRGRAGSVARSAAGQYRLAEPGRLLRSFHAVFAQSDDRWALAGRLARPRRIFIP